MLGYFNKKEKVWISAVNKYQQKHWIWASQGFSVLTPNIYDSSPEGLYACVLCHVL